MIPQSHTTDARTPSMTGIHHLGITVTDLARSLDWYTEMLGMIQWGEEHYPGGHTALLMRPDHSLHLGLDVHDRNGGESFAPHRTGLDHLALAAASRDQLAQWYAHLTGKGVVCSDIKDFVLGPTTGALFTFPDPDGIALEVITIDLPSQS